MAGVRGPRIDLVGREYGQLKVVAKSDRTDDGLTFPFWTCECKCGVTKDVDRSALVGGLTKSCGCARAARFKTHGLFNAYRREHAVYQAMIQRCRNPRSQKWESYGGRGIRVCRRWQMSFAAFMKDMGPRPSGRHSIERIDNDGPYTPTNCVWATRRQQMRNTRSSRIIAFAGKRMTLVQWAEASGVRPDTLWSRIHHGWPIEVALQKRTPDRVRGPDGRYLPRTWGRVRKLKGERP